MITSLIAAVAVVCIAGLGLWWHYLATADRPLTIINIPTWIAGSDTKRYSVAIGESQIKPYGTLWEATFGNGYVSNFPHYTEADQQAYAKRRAQKP